MLYAKVTDQRPLWEEKPSAGSKVFDSVNRVKQPDGSWLMDFSVKPGLAEGTYTGTVDFSVLVSPFPGTPNYQPRTASYSITVVGMKGTLSPLRQLSGATRQRFNLLQAELALSDKQPATVLQVLTENPAALPAALQARWYLARAQALEASGDAFAAAAERARAGTLLSGTARNDNQRAITRLLAGLNDA
ncbi:MAG: penicillin-binding protein activator, partial [Janthinobacterium sp.]